MSRRLLKKLTFKMFTASHYLSMMKGHVSLMAGTPNPVTFCHPLQENSVVPKESGRI